MFASDARYVCGAGVDPTGKGTTSVSVLFLVANALCLECKLLVKLILCPSFDFEFQIPIDG